MPKPIAKHADLVFDVGMHRGEDTAFYLKKGFRVVGFEAVPGLAAECRERFAAEIADGRVRIVEGAICPPGSGDTVQFFQNSKSSVWGTIHETWAARNNRFRAPSEVVEIAAVDFGECLHRFGMPHYLKIDIEGADTLCLEALCGLSERPDYVSLESCKTDFGELLREFELLGRAGFDRFAAVQQADIHLHPFEGFTRTGEPLRHVFEPGASGAFGPELPVPYLDKDAAIQEYRGIFELYRKHGDDGELFRTPLGRARHLANVRYHRQVLNKPLPGWYDTHAMRSS